MYVHTGGTHAWRQVIKRKKAHHHTRTYDDTRARSHTHKSISHKSPLDRGGCPPEKRVLAVIYTLYRMLRLIEYCTTYYAPPPPPSFGGRWRRRRMLGLSRWWLRWVQPLVELGVYRVRRQPFSRPRGGSQRCKSVFFCTSQCKFQKCVRWTAREPNQELQYCFYIRFTRVTQQTGEKSPKVVTLSLSCNLFLANIVTVFRVCVCVLERGCFVCTCFFYRWVGACGVVWDVVESKKWREKREKKNYD